VRQAAIDKKNFKKLVTAMLKQGTVRAPVRGARGVTLAEVSEKCEIVFDYANLDLPLKREFFPQCEVLATGENDGWRPAAPESGSPRIVFGVRPCDAQSLVYLDRVFTDEKQTDPFYAKRRDRTLVVSLACETAGRACFCTSVGGGPASTAGADIVAFNLQNSLLFESVTSRGEAFLAKNKALLRQPTPAEAKARKEQETHTLKQLPALSMTDAAGKLAKNFNSPQWEAIAETCLSCGACTYLCPTCHCFDICDEQHGQGDSKVRVHDACMFASFTREASGHNPRGRRRDRMRQRVMHKFSYAPENFGEIFCVGCGRCVVSCPSNIDIRETVSRMTA
jgi:sulfhydrogenase subunit beta (sulfur reductase)